MRKLTDAEVGALAICYYMEEEGRGFANLTKAGLVEAGNFLLRRGYVIRGEFKDHLTGEKSYGYRITNEGWDHACDIEPSEWIRCGNAVGLKLSPVKAGEQA